MRIPAFASADKINAIAGIADDASRIVKGEAKFLTTLRRSRKNHEGDIVALHFALLWRHSFVLKEVEILSSLGGDRLELQIPRELKGKKAFAVVLRAQLNRRRAFERGIGIDFCVQDIFRGAKDNGGRLHVRHGVRSPDVIVGGVAGLAHLAEEHWLVASLIENKIEWAGGEAFDSGIEIGARIFSQRI